MELIFKEIVQKYNQVIFSSSIKLGNLIICNIY